MKNKLAIINSSSWNCSYGGVAPFMRNMHPYLSNEFDVQYFHLPDPIRNTLIPNRIKIMFYLWRHRKEIKKCDFIISHIPEGSFVVSFFNIPYAHIFHGNDNPMSQSRYRYGKYFSFLFDCFFQRIEKTCRIKYTVGVASNDRKKLFNPINNYNFHTPSQERCGFIFAGRLEKIKNIDRLIRIYTKLPTQIQKDNHFYIAGFGSQENYLKNLVTQLGYNDKIHFLGNVPNTSLIKETSKRKLLIMASSQEGMPTAIAEALSVGVPVVSTNPGDIALVLKNDYNGYIFTLDFKDEDYVNAILAILDDYERFAKAAQKSSYVFNCESICNGIINDINSILSQQ